MADAFSEFYSGAMAPPDKLGGRLVPSLAPSRGTLADMYRDILPASSGGLTSRVVRTVPIDLETGNPIQAIDSVAPMAPGYQSDYVKAFDGQLPPTGPLDMGGPAGPAVAPPQDLASLYANMLGRNSAGFTGPDTMPVDSSAPLNMPGGGMGGAAARPAPPPMTPMQSLAAMFTPAKQPKLRSNELAGVHGGSKSMFGDNAVMPSSMNNSRWTTGY